MIVKIPEDVYQYENKVWGNFTARLLVFFLIALGLTAMTFGLLFWATNSIDLSATVAIIVCLPIMSCGIFKKDGQPLEKIIKYRYLAKFRYKQKRKYVMTNLYEVIQNNQKEWNNANNQIKEKIALEAQGKEKNHKENVKLGKERQRTK